MKATVRRDPTTRQWQATRPRLGFSGPEVRTFPTHQAALGWVDHTINRQGSMGAATQPKVTQTLKTVTATESTGQHYPRWQ